MTTSTFIHSFYIQYEVCHFYISLMILKSCHSEAKSIESKQTVHEITHSSSTKL